jgi:hypothetical protein
LSYSPKLRWPVLKFFVLIICLLAPLEGRASSSIEAPPKISSFKAFVRGLRHDLDYIKNILGSQFDDIYVHAEEVLDSIDLTIDAQESIWNKKKEEPMAQKKLVALNRQALARIAYFQEIMDTLQQALADMQAAESLKPYTYTEQKQLVVTAPREIRPNQETKKKPYIRQVETLAMSDKDSSLQNQGQVGRVLKEPILEDDD